MSELVRLNAYRHTSCGAKIIRNTSAWRVQRFKLYIFLPAEKSPTGAAVLVARYRTRLYLIQKCFSRNEIQGVADHVCGKFFSDGEGPLWAILSLVYPCGNLLVNYHVGLK
jgi:hypothetical protein